MKTIPVIIAILATLMSPVICQADQPKTGGYMSWFIGATALRDTTVTTDVYETVPNRTFTDKVEFDPGINVGMTGGYDFSYFRMEGELSYKQSSIDKITDKASNFRFRDVDGDIGILSMMFNGFFDLHNDSPVTPYFGGGIGLATLYLSDTDGRDENGDRIDLYDKDYDSVFAYQVGGGLEIALNSMLSLDLGYRYFGTSEAQFEDNWEQSTELDLKGHNVSVGLRLQF